ncbi:MAG: prepilin-type N-terminal cleavage/methylation domain-containing protein [Ruminococcaceae bacterium]|nr:prepilin-type N-terminal cleavage/methylation domain-containing protein [Oscillospiraceae bacterium]
MTMNSVVKKLNNKGVTLVELLVTVVLLTLVTGLISLAIDFGVRSFNKSNRKAEGQILCATLAASIKDELRYAKNVQGDDLGSLKFFSTNISVKNCSFSIADEGGNPVESGFIMLSTPQGEYDMVPKKTYVYDLKAKFTSFERDLTQPNPNFFKVGIQVLTQDDQIIAEEEFVVETLNG